VPAKLIFKNKSMSFIKYDQTEEPISDKEMLDLANRFLLSIKTRNWDLLRMIITKDCVWRWPGTSPVSGTAIGADSVIKEISGMKGRVNDIRLVKVSYGMNGVALSLHFYSTLANRNNQEDLITVCILRGYQIAGINTYLAGD
jgi:uncharacterized protein